MRTLAGASKVANEPTGTTRLGLFTQPAGHRIMVPANPSPKQRAIPRTKSVRIRNAR
jgi:hypothetical protein